MLMTTSSRKNHLDALAVSLLLACCLFWGFQQVLVKATIADLPPVFQASIRFAGATVLLWLWCHRRGVRLFKRDGSLFFGLLAVLAEFERELIRAMTRQWIGDPAQAFDAPRYLADHGLRPARISFYNHHLAHALAEPRDDGTLHRAGDPRGLLPRPA